MTLLPSVKRLQTRVDAGWGHPDGWLWCSIEIHWWRARLVGSCPCSLGSGMTKKTDCHFVLDTRLQNVRKVQFHALAASYPDCQKLFVCLFAYSHICTRPRLHDGLEFSAPRPRRHRPRFQPDHRELINNLNLPQSTLSASRNTLSIRPSTIENLPYVSTR